MLDEGGGRGAKGHQEKKEGHRFPSGWLLRQWESNWNYCLMTEIRKVGNGSFSEKLTAAAAGSGSVCGGGLRNVCSPRGGKRSCVWWARETGF